MTPATPVPPPLARPYLNQGDPRWAKVKAGRSRSATIGQVGCVLTCMAQAVRLLGIDRDSTPVRVQDNALMQWDGRPQTSPFSGQTASAFMGRVAAANQLWVGDRVNLIEGARAWGELIGSFDRGGFAMLHVDSRDDGSDEPNHWVLAIRLEGHGAESSIVYADPDGGHEGRLPLDTLRAPSPKGKPYEVRGLRRVLSSRAAG